jgi:hypothetical protein
VRRRGKVKRYWQQCAKCGEPIAPGGGVLCRAHVQAAQQERLAVGSIAESILARRTGAMVDAVVAAADHDVAQAITPSGQSLAVVAADAATQLAMAWGCRIGRT